MTRRANKHQCDAPARPNERIPPYVVCLSRDACAMMRKSTLAGAVGLQLRPFAHSHDWRQSLTLTPRRLTCLLAAARKNDVSVLCAPNFLLLPPVWHSVGCKTGARARGVFLCATLVSSRISNCSFGSFELLCGSIGSRLGIGMRETAAVCSRWASAHESVPQGIAKTTCNVQTDCFKGAREAEPDGRRRAVFWWAANFRSLTALSLGASSRER